MPPAAQRWVCSSSATARRELAQRCRRRAGRPARRGLDGPGRRRSSCSAAVPPGSRRRARCGGRHPTAVVRRWLVTCSRLDPAGPALLYEISRRDRRAGTLTTRSPARSPPTGRWPGWRTWPGSARGAGTCVRTSSNGPTSCCGCSRLTPGTPLSYADYRGRAAPRRRRDVRGGAGRGDAPNAPRSASRIGSDRRAAEERIFECHGEVVADADGAPARLFGTARDVTVQHRAQQELAYLADHDPLTGIANRRRITAPAGRVRRRPGWCRPAADRHRQLQGHQRPARARRGRPGDPAGRRHHRRRDRVGRRARVGSAATSSRWSLPGRRRRGRGGRWPSGCARAVAAAPIVDDVGALRVTISIGVAVASDDDVEASLAQADLALYAAKNAGRNRARLFADDQYDQAVRRVSLLRRVAGRAGPGHDAAGRAADRRPGHRPHRPATSC